MQGPTFGRTCGCTLTSDRPFRIGPSPAHHARRGGRPQVLQGDRLQGVLGPGPDHTFAFAIDGVVSGGVWTVAANLYAYGP